MNRERAKELLPIIQAFIEGKTIQYKSGSMTWEDVTNKMYPSIIESEYRIKPEPREFWIPGNDEGWMKINAMTNEEKEKADWGNSWIKVREVIE